MPEETVTISKSQYDQLQEDSTWLAALEAAGLDNWDGVDHARDILKEWEDDDGAPEDV